jgi:hypothetical protein
MKIKQLAKVSKSIATKGVVSNINIVNKKVTIGNIYKGVEIWR